MIILFIIGLLLGAVSVIFALQNTEVITVSFFASSVTGSLAVILLVALTVGIIITILIVLPESIQNYFRYRALQKENAKLQEELHKQKELTAFAKKDAPSSEVISSIEHGAIANDNR